MKLKLSTKTNQTELKNYENFYLSIEDGKGEWGLTIQIKPAFKRDYKTLRMMRELSEK